MCRAEANFASSCKRIEKHMEKPGGVDTHTHKGLMGEGGNRPLLCIWPRFFPNYALAHTHPRSLHEDVASTCGRAVYAYPCCRITGAYWLAGCGGVLGKLICVWWLMMT